MSRAPRRPGVVASTACSSCVMRDVPRRLDSCTACCVCWRIAAGVVGCWALLLLGLATDRLGATNAFVAAMHIRAAAALVLCIFDRSVQRCSCASRAALGRLLVSYAASASAALSGMFHAPSGGVVLACRNAIGSWEVSWTRAAAPRADERELPESGQGGAVVDRSLPRRRVGPRERCFAGGQQRPIRPRAKAAPRCLAQPVAV